jgi:Mg-chelatase subunit ChlD
MKKALLFISFSFLFASSLYSQDKSKFDLNFPINKSNSSLTMGTDHLLLSTEKTDITLLSGGYFTIGTNKGLSSGSLDDSCQITFGHPYAMTSYPYFRINGVNKYPDVYFYGQIVNLAKSADTLILTANEDPHVGFIFQIAALDGGNSVRAEVKIINKGLTAMDISAGIIFDPALGKWGDGFVFDSVIAIQTNKTYQNSIPHNFAIWERSTSPKGLGVSLNFPGDLPDRVDINNWFSLHNNQPDNQSALYDVALNLEKTKSIAPGDTISLTFDIVLLQPDFPNGLFIRSQIPAFFSIENNLLFPSQTIALTEIYNNSSTPFPNLNLNLLGGGYVDDYTLPASFTLAPLSKAYKNVQLISHEVYENIITPLKLDITNNGVLQDELIRNLSIPASPISDTGLAVEIDTVIANFPHIQFEFNATRIDNGSLLTSLSKENVFLYEDQQRISDFTIAKDTTGGADQSDIIFVLDVTGSMTNEIGGVKDNIVEFTDSLSRRGINFRLGMVTFLDYIENVYDFTSDVQAFQQIVSQQYAHAGGDIPENSLDALMRATQFDFRPEAKRIFIWITDANYHINDGINTNLTIQDVVNAVLSKSIVVNCIGDLQYQSEYYDPIVLPTGGNVFDINGNFRDIFLNISRIKSIGKYIVNYNSPGSPGSHEVNLDIHYAGLGGSKTFTYGSGLKKITTVEPEGVSCYPNPFNPSTNILLKNPGLFRGEAVIYNILGQKVKTFSFDSGQNPVLLRWDASNDAEIHVGNGIYFVRITYFNSGTARSLPVQKLLYIK